MTACTTDRVYISGPIMYASKGEDKFLEVADVLTENGMTPVSPKDVGGCPEFNCALLAHEIEKGMEHSWSCYLRYDLVAMLGCDAVAFMPGWQKSHGARLEHQVAAATGLQIWYYVRGKLVPLEG